MKYNPLATQKEIDAWYCSLSFRDKMNGWIFPHNSHFWNKEHTKEEIESIKKYECEICGTSVDNGYTGEAWVYNCCKKCFDEKIKPENPYLDWVPVEK